MDKKALLKAVTVTVALVVISLFFAPAFEEKTDWLYYVTLYSLSPWTFYVALGSLILVVTTLMYVRRTLQIVNQWLAFIVALNMEPKKKRKKKEREKMKMEDFKHV